LPEDLQMEMMFILPNSEDIWFKCLDYIEVKVRTGKVRID
jgi:hypothetical protein